MKRYWFFDLDGTLADTNPDIRAAWKATLDDLGLECPNFERDFIVGPPIEEAAKAVLKERYTDELGAAIREGFGRHYDHDGFPTTFEYPGIMDEVRRIKAAGARVFIATNKRFAGATVMAKKFGWMEVFEKLYTGDMHKDNPAIGKMRKPELLAFIMRELGARPEECVMVGDTINDFEAAEKNGLESVAVAWGYGTDAERCHATRFARTAQEIGGSL